MRLPLIILCLLTLCASVAADVVINEINYHPGKSSSEFLEITSTSATDEDLSGWQITGAVTFTFPANTSIAPGIYLVIARDPADHPGVGALGPYIGKLSNRGETIELRNASSEIVDSVRYADDGPWPSAADGDGPTLELIHPRLPNEYPLAWAPGPDGGTPGAINSAFTNSPVPFAAEIAHSPLVPTSGQSVTVHVRLVGLDETPSAWLFWRKEGPTSFNVIAMSVSGEEATATIPAQPDDTVVEFYIRVIGGAGSRFQPSTYPQVNYMVEFDNDAPTTSTPVVRVIMTEYNWTELEARDPFSDELLPATVISSGEIYHGVGIRYRGSTGRVEGTIRAYRVNFNDAQPLWGSVRKLNLNGFWPDRQVLSFDLFHSRGVPAPLASFATPVLNGNILYPHAVIEPLDEDFLERVFGDEDLPFYRAYDTANLEYRGSNPALYEHDYVALTDGSNHADVATLCNVFQNTTDENFESLISKWIDVDEWLTYFAVNAALSNQEGSIYRDTGDDYALVRSAKGKFLIVPWDMDTTFLNAEETHMRPTLPSIVRLLEHPAFNRRYREILLEIFDNELSRPTIRASVDALPDEFAGARDYLASWATARAINVREQIPSRMTGLAQGMGLSPVWALEESTYILPTITPASQWRYFVGTSEPSSEWTSPSFDDSSWPTATLPIGFGGEDDALALPEAITTVYLRLDVDLSTTSGLENVTQMIFDAVADDAFILYLNGTEIARRNITGNPDHTGTADTAIGDHAAWRFRRNDFLSLLHEGENTFAVQALSGGLADENFTFGITMGLTERPSYGLITQGDPTITIGGIAPQPGAWQVEIAGARTSVDAIDGEWQMDVASSVGINTRQVWALDENGNRIDRITLRWVYGPDAIEAGGHLPSNRVYGQSPSQRIIRLVADTTLPATSRFDLQPGAVVAFDPGVALNAIGEFRSGGTQDEPVILMPAVPGTQWTGIGFTTGSAGGTFNHTEILAGGFEAAATFELDGALSCFDSELTLANCVFRFCVEKAVKIINSEASIQSCHFHNSQEEIGMENVIAEVFNCTLTETASFNPWDSMDCKTTVNLPLAIRNNFISGGQDDGIDISVEIGEVTGNTITNFADKGFSVEGGHFVLLDNCVTDCETAVAVKDGANITIDGNTFVDCDWGVRVYQNFIGAGGAQALVTDTIIWDWRIGSMAVDHLSNLTVDYSDVEGGSPIPGTGNLDVDPMFIDAENHNFHLQQGSPLEGAGEGGVTIGAHELENGHFDGLIAF